MLTQSGKQIVVYILGGEGDGVCIFECDSLGLRVKLARGVVGKGFDLLSGDSELAAHGSVDVLSKLTPIERGHTTIQQSL